MSDEKKWVHWHSGMKQPQDLYGWYYKNHEKGWIGRGNFGGTELAPSGEYRKIMTDEEARVLFVLQACEVKCPGGHRIVDFRVPVNGDLIIDSYMRPMEWDIDFLGDILTPTFILEKIESEINWVEPTDQDAVELKRPAVRYRASESMPWSTGGQLVSADNSEFPYAVRHLNDQGEFITRVYMYCEMDASLREQGGDDPQIFFDSEAAYQKYQDDIDGE